jgi:hypothetical protein
MPNGRERRVRDRRSRRELVRSLPATVVKLRVARTPDLTIFKITEGELDELAHGASESHYLTVAIASFSIATTLLITLLTVSLSLLVSVVFAVICSFGYGLCLPLLFFWWSRRKSTAQLVKKIQNRLK